MYIGFAGTNAVGKSTIAKETKSKLEKKGYLCVYYSPFFKGKTSVWYKLWWGAKLWVYFDRDLVQYFLIKSSSSVVSSSSFWRLYQALILGYYLDQVKQNKYDVIIYDEDMVKWHAGGVVEGRVDFLDMADVYKHKIAPLTGKVFLVKVETEPNLSAKRFYDRLDVEPEKDILHQRAQKNKHSQKSIREVVDLMDNSDDSIVKVALDGEQTVSSNVEKLYKTIKNRVNE